jgi:hypothetical protein
LIDCKLLDKYNEYETIKSELSGISNTILDYITRNIREPLGELTESILKVSDLDFQERDKNNIIAPYLNRIKFKSDNSKSLTLELVNKYPKVVKDIISNNHLSSKVDLLVASTAKAISILSKVGLFVISTGTLETLYKPKPVSPENDKDKISMFDAELEYLKQESEAETKSRYGALINFINSITEDTFDRKKFIREEMIKVLSKIQTIILEEKPLDPKQLISSPKFSSLKIDDLLTITGLTWNNAHFMLVGETVDDFDPSFQVLLASDKGITSSETIVFREK